VAPPDDNKKPLRIAAGLRRLHRYLFLNLPAAVNRFLSSIVTHQIELVRISALITLFYEAGKFRGALAPPTTTRSRQQDAIDSRSLQF